MDIKQDIKTIPHPIPRMLRLQDILLFTHGTLFLRYDTYQGRSVFDVQ